MMSGEHLNQLYDELGFLFCKRKQKESIPIVFVSKAVESLLGYMAEEFLQFKHFKKLVHPDDLELFETLKTTGKDQSYTLAFRLKHKSGHYVYVLEKGQIVKEGKTLFLVGILTQIHPPQVPSIENSEAETFKELFNISSEGVIVHHNNVIQIANNAFYSIFGRTPEEVIGTDVFAHIAENEKDPQIDRILAELEANKQLNYQKILWFFRKDGKRIFVSVNGKPFIYKGQQMRVVLFRDITYEVEMQVALENSRAKYRAFAEASQDGIIIHDRGITQEVNGKICEMLGYTPKELINKPVSLLVTPEEIPKIMLFLRENEQDKENKRHEKIRALHKSGKVIDVSIWVNGFELDGKKLRFIVVRDISEETKAQQELERSHRKYKRLADITEEMIMVHDNGIVVEANNAFCDFLEIPESDIIGKHIIDLTPQNLIEEHKLTREKLDALYMGDLVSEGVHLREKNGKMVTCQYKETIFFVGKRRLRYMVMRNITDIQEAQEQLEASRKKFKQLADATNEMIIIHDNGKIVEVNRAFCEILGFEEQEIIGRMTTDLIPPSLREELQANLEEFQRFYQSGDSREGITYVLDKYGSKLICHFKASFFYDDGVMLRYTVLRDISKEITAQKALEDSLNKYKLIADATNEAIILQTLEGIVKEVNKTYCNLFITSPEEAIGKSCVEFVAEEELDGIFELFRKNRHINKENYTEFSPALKTTTLQKSTGERFVAEIQLSYTVINNELLRYIVIRDMTKIVQAQQLLQESNDKYKRLSNATKEGIIIHRDGVIIDVNQTVCKIFEWEETPLIGLHIQELTKNANIINSLQQSNSGKIDRILLQKQNGDTFIAEIWESDIDVDGEVLRYTVIRDITERIHYEQRIEELVESLSEKNKQLNCLFDLARLSSNKSYNLDELMEKTILLIPKSWQHPDICEVSLTFGQKEWQSDGFQKGIAFIEAPIICDGQKVGEIRAAYIEDCPTADEGPFLQSERALIDALGIQIGMLIEKRISEDRVVASILETEDRERTRIAKELHDSLGQLLMAISLNLEALKKDMGSLSDKSQQKLNNAINYLCEAIQESREISHSLMPKAINDYGYVLAVQSMLEGINPAKDINFHFYDNLEEERLNQKMELALFRITQEAVTNILKHAEAKNVTIQLMKYSDVLILTIEDDGIGFDANNTEEHFGFNSIRNRSNSLSAILTVESKIEYGTTIMIEVPL